MFSSADKEAAKNGIRAVKGQFGGASIRLDAVRVRRITKLPLPQLKLARRLAKRGKVLAVVWYAFVPKEAGNLFIYLPKRDRLLIRELQSSGAEERWEAMAIIIRATVDALIQGGSLGNRWRSARTSKGAKSPGSSKKLRAGGAETEAGPSRNSSSRRARPGSAEKKKKSTRPGESTAPSKGVKKKGSLKMPWRWGVGLAVAYLLDGYSTTAGATHGFYASLSFYFGASWAVVVDYRVQQEVTGTSQAVSTTVRRHPVGLGGRYRWERGRFGVGARLALVMDYATYATRVPGAAAIQTTGKRSGIHWSAAAFARGRIQLVKPLSLFLSLGLQVGLNPRRYVVETRDGERHELLKPWVVQPLFLVGLVAHVGG